MSNAPKKRPRTAPGLPSNVVRVVEGKGPHRVDTRVFARNIHEAYCMQKGCKFYGKHAQQGVCHTTKTFAGDSGFAYWEHLSDVVERHLVGLRKHVLKKLSLRGQVRRLESELACALINSWGQLDEMVRLRRDAALWRASQKEARHV